MRLRKGTRETLKFMTAALLLTVLFIVATLLTGCDGEGFERRHKNNVHVMVWSGEVYSDSIECK